MHIRVTKSETTTTNMENQMQNSSNKILIKATITYGGPEGSERTNSINIHLNQTFAIVRCPELFRLTINGRNRANAVRYT